MAKFLGDIIFFLSQISQNIHGFRQLYTKPIRDLVLLSPLGFNVCILIVMCFVVRDCGWTVSMWVHVCACVTGVNMEDHPLFLKGVVYFSSPKNKDNPIQWNLVIKRSDITKSSYNKVILLVPALYISVFYPIFVVPRTSI